MTVSARAAILLVLAASLSARAQQPTFRTRTDRVRVDVLVTAGGRSIEGLAARDFDLRDNGVPQRAEVLESGGPVKVLLVLDTSASVLGDRLGALVAASNRLIDSLKPGDKVGLLTFSERLRTRVPVSADWDSVRGALAGVRAGGRTALFDAVFAGLAQGGGESGRWLVIVCSDGADTASFLQGHDVLAAARRSSVVAYGVTVNEDAWAAFAERSWLQLLGEATGGEVVRASDDEDLSRVFVDVLQEFRSRYVLAYSPEGVKIDDGWHELDVRVKRQGASVRARRGYMAVR